MNSNEEEKKELLTINQFIAKTGVRKIDIGNLFDIGRQRVHSLSTAVKQSVVIEYSESTRKIRLVRPEKVYAESVLPSKMIFEANVRTTHLKNQLEEG